MLTPRDIKYAIDDMRYGSRAEVVWYWAIKIGLIALAVIIVAIIAGTVYCKVKGIDVPIPFI